MNTHAQNSRIAQTASEWIVRCDRGLTPEEEREFAAWKAADPRHGAELNRIGSAWRGMDFLGADAQLEAMADAVLDRAQARRSESRKPGRRWLAGMAAAAALAVGVFSWQSLRVTPPPIEARASSETFYVLKSSLQRLPLPDGSVAELNGATRIEVEYTSAERRVRVIDGEVHFVVAKATDRPFVVVADDVIVRAVGTAFNVRFDTGKIEVLVTEGKVKLMTPAPGAGPSASPVAVAAAGEALVEGQRAVIPRTDVAAATPPVVEIATVNRTEIQEALDWQSTRLVFQDTPLEEAIAGFNRFNRRQLTLGDPALKTRRLSGTFRADNLEGFLRVVRFTVDVKAEPRTALETVLLPIH